jgi:ankyrin repeat protein
MFQAGADVNAGRPVTTPLIVAASYGFASCIKCLLEAGADTNIPDEVSFCTATYVVSCHYVDILCWLTDGLI